LFSKKFSLNYNHIKGLTIVNFPHQTEKVSFPLCATSAYRGNNQYAFRSFPGQKFPPTIVLGCTCSALQKKSGGVAENPQLVALCSWKLKARQMLQPENRFPVKLGQRKKKGEKRERFPGKGSQWITIGEWKAGEIGENPRRKHPLQILGRRVILSRVGATLFYLWILGRQSGRVHPLGPHEPNFSHFPNPHTTGSICSTDLKNLKMLDHREKSLYH